MNYSQLFKHAWNLVWSNWRIWFFSLLVITPEFIWDLRYLGQNAVKCLFLILAPLFIFLSLAGDAGIIHNIRLQQDEQIPTLKETWEYIKPLLGRLFITTILGVLIIFTLYLIPAIFIKVIGLPSWVQELLIGSFRIFVFPFLTFLIIVIVVDQFRIFESLKHALTVVSVNLSQILTISLIFYLIWIIYQQIAAIVTLGIQSGFSIEEMNTFYFGMYLDLQGSLILMAIDKIYLLLIIPFELAVYTLAYLRFKKNTVNENNNFLST